MCLVLLALRAHPGAEIILAGNRDEHHSRPSAAPALVARDPRVHAGLDLEAGGTWMGCNEAGLVVALTNRRARERPVPEGARSRGEIGLALLRQRDPARAAQWMEGIERQRYRPFNVLFGTAESFHYFSSDAPADPRRIEPGFYVLSNSTLDDRSWPKVQRSYRFWERHRMLPGERLLLAMQAFLCDATPPDTLESADRDDESHGSLGAVFIRRPGYGTVSSSIITLGGSLGERYYFAKGEEMYGARHAMARHLANSGGAIGADAAPAESGGGENPFRLVSFGE
jgi:uncharacterized protein with NRDE domain